MNHDKDMAATTTGDASMFNDKDMAATTTGGTQPALAQRDMPTETELKAMHSGAKDKIKGKVPDFVKDKIKAKVPEGAKDKIKDKISQSSSLI